MGQSSKNVVACGHVDLVSGLVGFARDGGNQRFNLINGPRIPEWHQSECYSMSFRAFRTESPLRPILSWTGGHEALLSSWLGVLIIMGGMCYQDSRFFCCILFDGSKFRKRAVFEYCLLNDHES